MNSQLGHVCYLCFSENSGRIGMNADFNTDIFICNDCGLIQNNFVSHFYLGDYYHKRYRETRREAISDKYLQFMSLRAYSQHEFIAKSLPDVDRLGGILDIGASAGKLLGTFKGQAVLHAVESDPDMVRYLEGLGTVSVLDESVVFSREFRSSFDLVTLSHVFEHINNPLEYLYRLSTILSDGGYVFMEVPNEPIELVTHHVKKKKRGIGHLFDYTIDTLNRMVERSGIFDVLAMRTYSVSIAEYLNGSSIRNFEENPSGNGIHIRCLLKKRPSASIPQEQHRYIDAVLQTQYRRQLLNERRLMLAVQGVERVQRGLSDLRARLK